MDWLPLLQLPVMGFTVVGVFIMYRDQMRHLRNMHVQARNTWNKVAETDSHIAGLHDKYAKLYDRVKELEKTNEIHG
jgi:hypothetical protein